jgi:hypothetical protein
VTFFLSLSVLVFCGTWLALAQATQEVERIVPTGRSHTDGTSGEGR